MTHNSFSCFWNRVVVPLFVCGSASEGIQPSFEQLSKDEKEVLLKYVYEYHNLDDFYTWLRGNSHTGAKLWLARFDRGDHELVSAPTPGPVLYTILMSLPIFLAVLIIFLCHALYLGLCQIF